MNNHVPDLERCRKLKGEGFPQEEICLYWMSDWTRKYYHVGYTNDDDYRICAAPIVTELVEEIRKFAKPQESEMLVPVIEMYLSEMGDWNVGSIAQFQVSDEADYCNATTLPNALADLWCELKEGKCL